MDLSRPVEALVPGARGKILAALAAVEHELSTSDVGRISGVSLPQASRVLAALVELGVVERRDVPPAVVYRLVPGNAVGGLVRELADLRSCVVRQLRTTITALTPTPVRAVLFGSVARGTSDRSSDIDVMLIRPKGWDTTDAWTESVGEWREAMSRFAGSPVNVAEIDEEDEPDRSTSDAPLWREIAAEGIVLLDRERSTTPGLPAGG